MIMSSSSTRTSPERSCSLANQPPIAWGIPACIGSCSHMGRGPWLALVFLPPASSAASLDPLSTMMLCPARPRSPSRPLPLHPPTSTVSCVLCVLSARLGLEPRLSYWACSLSRPQRSDAGAAPNGATVLLATVLVHVFPLCCPLVFSGPTLFICSWVLRTHVRARLSMPT